MTFPVVGVNVGIVDVGVTVVPTMVLPYAEAAQIHRRRAVIIVPHPRPIFVFQSVFENQCRNSMAVLEADCNYEVVDTELSWRWWLLRIWRGRRVVRLLELRIWALVVVA